MSCVTCDRYYLKTFKVHFYRNYLTNYRLLLHTNKTCYCSSEAHSKTHFDSILWYMIGSGIRLYISKQLKSNFTKNTQGIIFCVCIHIAHAIAHPKSTKQRVWKDSGGCESLLFFRVTCDRFLPLATFKDYFQKN